jgi:hypothetical protein
MRTEAPAPTSRTRAEEPHSRRMNRIESSELGWYQLTSSGFLLP